jgi:hypothetical protein
MSIENDRKEPKVKRSSKFPTLVGGLGFLNVAHCPTCNRFLFAFYDNEQKRIGQEWNYCLECGQHLDLDKYKNFGEDNVEFDD